MGKEFVVLPTAKPRSNKSLEFELTGQKPSLFEFSDILVQAKKGPESFLFSDVC